MRISKNLGPHTRGPEDPGTCAILVRLWPLASLDRDHVSHRQHCLTWIVVHMGLALLGFWGFFCGILARVSVL